MNISQQKNVYLLSQMRNFGGRKNTLPVWCILASVFREFYNYGKLFRNNNWNERGGDCRRLSEQRLQKKKINNGITSGNRHVLAVTAAIINVVRGVTGRVTRGGGGKMYRRSCWPRARPCLRSGRKRDRRDPYFYGSNPCPPTANGLRTTSVNGRRHRRHGVELITPR